MVQFRDRVQQTISNQILKLTNPDVNQLTNAFIKQLTIIGDTCITKQKPTPKKQGQGALGWNTECDRDLQLRKAAEQKAHQYPCDANIIAYLTAKAEARRIIKK